MIQTKYVIQDRYQKTIALFADVHFSEHYSNKVLKQIIQNLKQNQPDYICIPGDIVDDAKVFDDKNLFHQLKNWLKTLATIAPVILSYGNHDEIYLKWSGERYTNTASFFNELNQTKNIYFLDNENKIFDNINFIGYHPDKQYFRQKEHYNLTDDLKKMTNKIKGDYYNILLCHSPSHILEYHLPIDLILSGHMHDGLVFPFLKKMRGNFGFVGPHHTFFPRNSRGMIEKEGTKLIITGGIRKVSSSSLFLLKPLNLIYPPEITYIKI